MKHISTLACFVPLVAATWDLNLLEYASAVPNDYSADSSECEFPANFTIYNLQTSGPSTNNLSTISFGFVDSETDTIAICTAESVSSERSPCDDNTNVEFIWALSFVGDDTPDQYKLTMIETICNTTYEVSGAWIPTLSCQNNTSSTGVTCGVPANATSYTAKFSSLNPVQVE